MDLAKAIQEDGGWIALAVILTLLFLVLLVWAMVKLITTRDKSADAVTIQAESNADIVRALVEPFAQFVTQLQSVSQTQITISKSQQVLGEQMQTLANCLIDHEAQSKADRESNVLLVQQTKTTVEANAKLIAAVPGQVKASMAEDFERINKQYDDVKDVIKTQADNLVAIDGKITLLINRLDEVPPQTAAVLRGDLSELKALVMGLAAKLERVPPQPPAVVEEKPADE